jgi:hypothetical protein
MPLALSRLLPWATASLAVALLGCAHTGAATPVVEIGGSGPTTTTDPTPSLPPAANDSGRLFVGTWQDNTTAGHVNTRVDIVEGVPTVTSIKEVIGDIETFKVESSTFRKGELRWVYFVPSTEYRVVMTATKPIEGKMPTTWSNSADASGSTDLIRVDKQKGADKTDEEQ